MLPRAASVRGVAFVLTKRPHGCCAHETRAYCSAYYRAASSGACTELGS